MGRWTAGGTMGYPSVRCTEDWEEFVVCDVDTVTGIGASVRFLNVMRSGGGGTVLGLTMHWSEVGRHSTLGMTDAP